MTYIFDLFWYLVDGCFLFTDIYFLICCGCIVALFSSLILYLSIGKY